MSHLGALCQPQERPQRGRARPTDSLIKQHFNVSARPPNCEWMNKSPGFNPGPRGANKRVSSVVKHQRVGARVREENHGSSFFSNLLQMAGALVTDVIRLQNLLTAPGGQDGRGQKKIIIFNKSQQVAFFASGLVPASSRDTPTPHPRSLPLM